MKRILAVTLSLGILLTGAGPEFAQVWAGPVVGPTAGGRLFAPVSPALAAAFSGFAAGDPLLSGMDIAPIAVRLQARGFLPRALQVQALRAAGDDAAARALAEELQKDVLAARDQAAPEVSEQLKDAVVGLSSLKDAEAIDRRILSLEAESRGLESYAADDVRVIQKAAARVRSGRTSSWVEKTARELTGKPVVNDVTQLNPIVVDRIEAPTTIEEIVALVKAHPGPVSIGGGRYSQGGQTATEDALQIDMRRFNKVLELRPQDKTITVQAGARWRDIQKAIDGSDLAVKVMQTYSNFTVGGALSVNAHGRYIGLGPTILSVRSIKVVLADGSIVKAGPNENPEIFYGAVGGYGGIGVITEATLELADNAAIQRTSQVMPRERYKDWFFKNVRDSKTAVFHNADLYMPYRMVRATTWSHTDKPVTVKERRIPEGKDYRIHRWIIFLMMHKAWGPISRPWAIVYRKVADFYIYRKQPVVWRNHEASYDVAELEPASRAKTTYVLQEYFVPVEQFDAFVTKMAEILTRYGVNAMNVSVRHAKADPGSLLAWARNEVFAFVLYYQQGVRDFEKGEVAVWTRELIDAALASGGAYYLPYQIHATLEQFFKAYPRAPEYFSLKATVDPTNKFRNKLWDAYYPHLPAQPGEGARRADEGQGNFRTVFAKTTLRDAFYRFLQVVYRRYPESRFHHLIAQLTAQGGADQQIYRRLQERLPEIAPFLRQVRYALPSLIKQKQETADQTRRLLGDGLREIDGYVEIGTTGRYVTPLRERFKMKGPVYLLPLWTWPNYSPADVFERGRLRKIGKPLKNDYDPIRPEEISDASVDLVTVYIGLHHAPREKLDAFVRSLHRILRPGGRLVIRDHQVDSLDMDAFVGLAHDVHNAGRGLPWEENAKELRHFTSITQESAYLEARGFKDTGKRLLQANDPTANTLMEFVKVDTPHPAFGHPLPSGERAG